MIILGIDPGSRTTGIAIVEAFSRRPNLLFSDALVLTKESEDFIPRLKFLYSHIEAICHQYRPNHLALESLIHVKNVSSLAKLAQARGVIIAAALQSTVTHVQEYAPNLVKQTIAGHGHADKEMIQKALGMILGIKNFKSHDESDAIAMAITHSLIVKSPLAGSKMNSLKELRR